MGTVNHVWRHLRGTPDLLISYSSRSKHLAIRFMDLRDWIIDDKLVIDHVFTYSQLGDILTKFLVRPIFTELLNAIIKDQLSAIYILTSHFLDVPVKISVFLDFSLFSLSKSVSNFPIQVSIVGACWNNCLLSACV